MSELRNRMTRDMKLAGLVEGTSEAYLRAVRQLAAYYMIPPDQLNERQAQDYLLYVRDDLGVAKGTFAHLLRAQVLLCPDSRLRVGAVHEKKVRSPRQKRLPDVRSDDDCRRLIATLEKPVYRGCFTLIYAYGLRIGEAIMHLHNHNYSEAVQLLESAVAENRDDAGLRALLANAYAGSGDMIKWWEHNQRLRPMDHDGMTPVERVYAARAFIIHPEDGYKLADEASHAKTWLPDRASHARTTTCRMGADEEDTPSGRMKR